MTLGADIDIRCWCG